MDVSDLESTSDSDDEMKMLRKGRKARRSGRIADADFSYAEDVSAAGYHRQDSFKIEKFLLIYGLVLFFFF